MDPNVKGAIVCAIIVVLGVCYMFISAYFHDKYERKIDEEIDRKYGIKH
jgi:hypothetical protein